MSYCNQLPFVAWLQGEITQTIKWLIKLTEKAWSQYMDYQVS